MTDTFHMPYGNSTIKFNLPHMMQADVAVSRAAESVTDMNNAIREALAHPIGTSPLIKMAGSGNRVCIVFTDITRASPDHLLVSALLKELERAGVRDEDITLLCGIGMHRPSTQAEKVTKLGADVVDRYRVIDNEPQNPAATMDEALSIAAMDLGPACRVLIVPHALLTLPVIQDGKS